MLGLYVSVPVACFRKALAREFLETEPLPPPATCYGFLLSLVGETDRRRHVGCRVCPVLLGPDAIPKPSLVLRTVWRVKSKPLGSLGNTRPDFQQLLTGTELVVWLDSSDEPGGDTVEARVRRAMADPGGVSRFGGLSLGESTHLVDEVVPIERRRKRPEQGHAFLTADRGRMTLPVWVDHVGSKGTRYVTGDLEPVAPGSPPPVERMPKIADR